jgi:hypothetical protein
MPSRHSLMASQKKVPASADASCAATSRSEDRDARPSSDRNAPYARVLRAEIPQISGDFVRHSLAAVLALIGRRRQPLALPARSKFLN